MTNYRNVFEFRSGLLDALGVEHSEADAKNEERLRAKMLDGLGVEYNQNDVNQFDLFRAKLVEGVGNYSGGGGSSDFSTAEVTINNESGKTIPVIYIQNVIEENALGAGSPSGVINAAYNIGSTGSIRVPLYKGGALWQIGDELLNYEISVSGSATKVSSAIYHITGDCVITISVE